MSGILDTIPMLISAYTKRTILLLPKASKGNITVPPRSLEPHIAPLSRLVGFSFLLSVSNIDLFIILFAVTELSSVSPLYQSTGLAIIPLGFHLITLGAGSGGAVGSVFTNSTSPLGVFRFAVTE
ncbi:hypothetical protein PMIN06_005234 [Paraphaeosphaeria minitans]